jgi:hypothetical protein
MFSLIPGPSPEGGREFPLQRERARVRVKKYLF